MDTQSSALLLEPESSRHPTNIPDPVTETINNRTEPNRYGIPALCLHLMVAQPGWTPQVKPLFLYKLKPLGEVVTTRTIPTIGFNFNIETVEYGIRTGLWIQVRGRSFSHG